MIRIAPSILSADFSRLGEELRTVQEAGADLLHVDVMDGHYVNNITFGPMIVAAVNKLPSLRLSTHLMIQDPAAYAEAFIQAGSDDIIVHAEVLDDARPLLRRIRELGARAGVTTNPATPFSVVEPYLADIDVFLVMSVNPGWGGQAFIPEALQKAERAAAHKRAHGLDYEIHIDGGIDPHTAPLAVEAGVEVLVAGSAVFKAPSPAEAVRTLRRVGEAAL